MTDQLHCEQLTPSTLLVTPTSVVFEAGVASELKSYSKEVIANPVVNMVLDLQKVTYVDSFGLASILSVLKSCKEIGGALILLNPNSTVLQLIQLTKLSTILAVVETQEDALQLIQKQADAF